MDSKAPGRETLDSLAMPRGKTGATEINPTMRASRDWVSSAKKHLLTKLISVNFSNFSYAISEPPNPLMRMFFSKPTEDLLVLLTSAKIIN
jgi:hypothetical protein